MSTRFSALSGQDASAVEEQKRKAEEREQRVDYKMVTFSLGGKDYGIDIMKVKEIAKFSHFTYVPNTPSYVRGVYNLRGDIISVIDLRTMFQLPIEERPEGAPEEGLILRLEDRLLGVVVDEIDKVVGIQSETIQPPHPIFGDINIKYISGVVEHDERLYIILDVERVFSKDSDDAGAAPTTSSPSERPAAAEPETEEQGVDSASSESGQPSEEPETAQQPVAQPGREGTVSASSQSANDFDFVTEALATFGVLFVSDLNREWVEKRFESWKQERENAGKSVQFENQDDAYAFLNGFYSPHTGQLWEEEYFRAVEGVVPELTGGAVNVWNPGCGKGHESYSFTVLCKRQYPEARIKVWASDNDLLSISTAPSVVFDLETVPEIYTHYMVSGNNGYSFSSEIKDAIVFEYHDVTHESTLPELDVILMRDLLSLLSVEDQTRVINRASERLRPGGIFIPGTNEDLSGHAEFKRVGSEVNAYRRVEEQGAT